jgi:pimeloyl-ACP methyl ester carboxylesterase
MPDLTINGYKHHYEEAGDGQPMVWIAGTRFDSAREWAPFMQEHAQGFRMIMPDIRGMADSEHTRDVTAKSWVEDLGAFLDALRIDRIHLMAETLGTRVITRFALEHPERVRTLILNGPIAYSSPDADRQRVQQADPASITPKALARLERFHGKDALEVNSMYVNLHAQPEFQEYYDLRKVAPSVHAPVLIMRGDRDEDVHPVAHSAELHKLFPKSWLAIFPNTSFNALRAHPQEAWQLIREFLAANE